MDLEIDDNPTCHAPVWFYTPTSIYISSLQLISIKRKEDVMYGIRKQN